MADFKKAKEARNPKTPPPCTPPPQPHITIYLDAEGFPRYTLHGITSANAYDFEVGCYTALGGVMRLIGRPIPFNPPRR